MSELPLSSMSENRCCPCILFPLPDLPRFPHTQACACTDVCTCVFAHMHAHTHMYDIHTLPLATLTEIQSPKAGRGGPGRIWSQLERSSILSPRGPWSRNRTTKLGLPTGKEAGLCPLVGESWTTVGVVGLGKLLQLS